MCVCVCVCVCCVHVRMCMVCGGCACSGVTYVQNIHAFHFTSKGGSLELYLFPYLPTLYLTRLHYDMHYKEPDLAIPVVSKTRWLADKNVSHMSTVMFPVKDSKLNGFPSTEHAEVTSSEGVQR